MKTSILSFLAVVAMTCAPTAFGQAIQQPTSQVVPIVSPQEWANSPAAQNVQQPTLQNAAYGNNANGNATGNPGCDSNGGSGGCDSGCQSGCGLGGNCGAYDPCCPTKYFSIFGGFTTFQDIDYSLDLNDPNGGSIDLDAILEMKGGWGLGSAVGRSLGRNTRGEFEFTYRTASVESGAIVVDGRPVGSAELDGTLDMYSFMPNLLFDLCPKGRFNVYAGVGAGIVFKNFEIVEPSVERTPLVEADRFKHVYHICMRCVSPAEAQRLPHEQSLGPGLSVPRPARRPPQLLAQLPWQGIRVDQPLLGGAIRLSARPLGGHAGRRRHGPRQLLHHAGQRAMDRP